MTNALYGIRILLDGYDTEDSGRRGDTGSSTYSHNRNSTKTEPKYMEASPTNWIDAMTLTEDEVNDGTSVIIADPSDASYAGDSAVQSAWANYTALNAVVPERVLKVPSGSRGDVRHSANWKDGVWVNEFSRKLDTSSSIDDVIFDTTKKYEFSIAIFDNCGRGEIPPGHTTYGNGQYQILKFKQ